MNIEHEIQYFKSGVKPPITVEIREVTKGVFVIMLDFFERFTLDCEGSDGDWVELYFADPHDVNDSSFVVKMKLGNGMLMGDVTKKTYYGTFYSSDVWDNIWK